MANKDLVLSGMRPTGRLHLGNLLGALKMWVELQDKYHCFYMVADWHALTTNYEHRQEIKENILQMVIDWLSVGISPEKSVIFRQSQVLEHAELCLLLSNITPLPWLFRNPTYKEQIRELKKENTFTYGFLGYPVLQAADILLYKSNLIPVGEDQLPHIELTREIARRFNNLYQKVFPIPQQMLTNFPKLVGTDGRKMSKSYQNCLYLSDQKETIVKKIKSMITDPARIRISDKGHPDICSVFALFQSFSSYFKKYKIEEECKEGKLPCVKCKEWLSLTILEDLKEIHERRLFYEKNHSEIEKILEKGKEEASQVAQKTMAEVRSALQLT
ncbi:tryptophan--tRNA ligase [bacterium]|nr:tryptophan--tRNA ligase [bacterium]MBU1152453.1 tryptophan--tRNA ligase [bacterium]